MKISPNKTGQSRLKKWFYNRERTPNVIGSSPADNLRDTISIGASTALVGAAAAGTVAAVGAGALMATALAVPLAVAGAIGGAILAGVTQEAAGALLQTGPSYDEGGALAGGGVMGGLVGAGAAVAAGFGAAPLTVALAAVGIAGGLMALASAGIKAAEARA